MKLNCDVGETDLITPESIEYQVMPYVNMVNIACGFHAGNEQVMQDCIKLAKQFNVQIGAHPGYPDIENFGRVSMGLSQSAIIELMGDQISIIKGIADNLSYCLHYVKPHGAFYNDMMSDDLVLEGVLEGMRIHCSGLPLVIMATCENKSFQEKAQKKGVRLILEAFADRRYTDQGLLQSRQKTDSVYNSHQAIMNQAQSIKDGFVKVASGKKLTVRADTICVHGDNPASVAVISHLGRMFSH